MDDAERIRKRGKRRKDKENELWKDRTIENDKRKGDRQTSVSR